MSLIEPCRDLWGQADIIAREPDIGLYRDAVYFPFAPGARWGLFDAAGAAIRPAVDFRGRTEPAYAQALDPTPDPSADYAWASAGTYIYGGTINPHFGHFLISSLPRFWNMTRIRTPNTPILCHGPGTPSDWFRIPFLAAIFSYLGLAEHDFVTFNESTRIRAIVVPHTSLEEQATGYRAYGTLCHAIGARIYDQAEVDRNDVPVYYSKTRLASAVGVIVNEVEIEAVLRAAGVDIVYPETLSFAQQVRLMAERSSIIGTAGSFLHTSIFCPPRRITCLNVTSQINSNFSIIDALAGNAATYHYPPGIQVLDRQDGFLTSRFLPEAAEVAGEILEIARAHSSTKHKRANEASRGRNLLTRLFGI